MNLMIYDLIIIGSGPAGSTAAIYAARKGLKTLVISKEIGGRLTRISTIENYAGFDQISGIELAQKFIKHLKKLKIEIQETTAAKIIKENNLFTVKTSRQKLGCKTLIIATGAYPKTLDIKGEEIFKNKGVTYCATCDAPLFAGKKVAVIGSGNSALETAMQLANIAKKIYLINNASRFQGDEIFLEKLKENPRIEIINKAYALEIKGDKSVKSLKIKRQGKERDLDILGIFVNIGYIPNTSIVSEFVKLNEKKEIEIDQECNTSAAGIFSAGDCTNMPYKQIIISAGSGAIAALSAFKYLTKI